MRICGYWVVGLGMMAALGCSAPDPGVDVLGPQHNNALNGGTSTPTPGTDSGTSNPTPVADSSVPVQDAGGAADTSPPPAGTNAFSGQPAYSTDPTSDKASNHHTVAAQGFTSPAGKDCMTCHGAGGPGTQFAFGGTVYAGLNTSNGAADVQIRVVDSAGKEQGSAHSDVDGNFWVVSTTALPTGSIAGGRSAASTNLMISAAKGNCNNCHKTGGVTTPIHVP